MSCDLPIFSDWHRSTHDPRGPHHTFCFYDQTCVARRVPAIGQQRRPLRIARI